MNELFPSYFQREDEASDFEFYKQPRLVAHIDDAAISALGAFFRTEISEAQNGIAVLDLMSAYLTHLPQDVRERCSRVAGLGMNATEMAANRQLTEHIVHNLNDDPRLPFADETFDAALCTVSVQYLQHPLEVFGEVRRTLRPRAPLIVSFSNRCFPTKATALWRNTNDAQHLSLMHLYFEKSGAWTNIQAHDLSPQPGHSDPLYVVIGRKG